MKSRICRSLSITTVILSSLPLSHAIAQTNFAPFKAVCISEESIGYSWRDGRWVRATYPAGERFLVQKLDVDAYRTKPLLEQPILCFKGLTDTSKSIYEDRGCYLVKDFGSAKTTIHGEVCAEYFDGKKPIKIVCKSMTFLPDGSFVSSPEYADISQDPSGGRKDSLALSVGRCSRLAD